MRTCGGKLDLYANIRFLTSGQHSELDHYIFQPHLSKELKGI